MVHRSEYVTMWLRLSWGSNLCSTLHIPIGLAIYPKSGHSEWLFRFALEISSNIMGLVTHGGGLMMMLAGPYCHVYIYIYRPIMYIYIYVYICTYLHTRIPIVVRFIMGVPPLERWHPQYIILQNRSSRCALLVVTIGGEVLSLTQRCCTFQRVESHLVTLFGV